MEYYSLNDSLDKIFKKISCNRENFQLNNALIPYFDTTIVFIMLNPFRVSLKGNIIIAEKWK